MPPAEQAHPDPPTVERKPRTTALGLSAGRGVRPARRRRSRARTLVAIAAGGALGAPARQVVEVWLPSPASGFPWATLLINVTGAFLLGLLLILLSERLPSSRYARPFLATGLIGAFTTFSTFAVETDTLVRLEHPATAAAYVGATLAAGLTACWFGVFLGRLAGTAGTFLRARVPGA